MKQEVPWPSYFSLEAEPLSGQNPVRKWLFRLEDQSIKPPFITRGHREVTLHHTQKRALQTGRVTPLYACLDLVASPLQRPKEEEQILPRSRYKEGIFRDFLHHCPYKVGTFVLIILSSTQESHLQAQTQDQGRWARRDMGNLRKKGINTGLYRDGCLKYTW